MTQAEESKKSWHRYTEELCKKDLNDLDKHNGVVTHVKLAIQECKVNWALGGITTKKKTRKSDRIPVKLIKILKHAALKKLHSICQEIWKAQSGQRTGKGQFSFQIQRKAIQKNVQVQFSCSVMSDCLQPHESQHVKPPCPSPTSRGHSDSRPSSP